MVAPEASQFAPELLSTKGKESNREMLRPTVSPFDGFGPVHAQPAGTGFTLEPFSNAT